MNLLELKDTRCLASEKATALIERAKAEKRKLDETEQAEFNGLTVDIQNLNSEIALAELRNIEQPIIKIQTNKTNKMNKNFSLLRAIEARANGMQLDEATVAVINQGKEEMRKAGISFSGDIVLPLEYRADIVAGTATAGQEVVNEQKLGILEPLRESLVLVKAGATFLTGLVGDVSIPTYGGTSALWKGEIVSADDGAGAFSEVVLQPKKITAYINVSKQFLNQDSINAEQMLMRDIVNAVAIKLEGTILGKAAGSSTQPAGMFATAPAINGVTTFANMVLLEANVDTSNALVGNCSYITNAGGRQLLKSTPKVSGQPIYLLDKNEMNGYPVYVTNNVAKQLQAGTNEFGVAFGNWSDYIVAQWGAMDLIVDPYTVAKNGEVQIVINAYFDAKPRRTASFAVASIK